jgi:hypothetical protein
MRHSDDEMEDYTMDVVRAVRAKDVTKLRAMLREGRSTACLESCNRNHEYILHLACRRGNVETVRFLVHEARVSTSVVDDLGSLHFARCVLEIEPRYTAHGLVAQFWRAARIAAGARCSRSFSV